MVLFSNNHHLPQHTPTHTHTDTQSHTHTPSHTLPVDSYINDTVKKQTVFNVIFQLSKQQQIDALSYRRGLHGLPDDFQQFCQQPHHANPQGCFC